MAKLAGLLLLGIAAAGQVREEPKRARLEGVVRNAGTGEPIRKAEIILVSQREPRSETSDAEGRFVLKDVAPGRYTLQCERRGFVGAAYGAKRYRPMGVTLELKAGEEIKNIDFNLTAQAVITGRVMDDEREPVANSTVRAVRREGGSAARYDVFGGEATTNDIGEFRLAGLPAGKWMIAATAPRPVRVYDAPQSAPTGLVSTYYPATLDPDEAAVFDLQAGQEVSGIEIRLVRTASVRVSGNALSAEGTPAPDVQMSLSSMSGLFSGLSTESRKSDGAFEFVGVVPGRYELVAMTRSGDGYYTANVIEPIDVGNEGIADLRVRLRTVVEVRGKVVLEGEGTLDFGKLHLQLSRAQAGRSFGVSGSVRSDSAFVLTAPAGSYRAAMFGLEDDYRLKGIKTGVATSRTQELEIAPGMGEVELLITRTAARLRGVATTKDGEPALSAVVLLARSDGTGRPEFRAARTGQTGNFEFGGLAPGEYKLFALEDLEPTRWEDPDLLKENEENAVPVKLRTKEQATIELTVQPAPGRPDQ